MEAGDRRIMESDMRCEKRKNPPATSDADRRTHDIRGAKMGRPDAGEANKKSIMRGRLHEPITRGGGCIGRFQSACSAGRTMIEEKT
jgi:hypothetical protein